jgi:RimJ/RimL family protein N-acetyltransferase
VTAPAIETARLRLREHRREDFASCAAMWSQPEVTRYIGGRPFTEEETWARFLRYTGHWVVVGFGYWVIEDRETGTFLGEAGFADFKRDIEPRIDGTPEVGWVLTPGAHGKGYATEAVRAVLAWGEMKANFQRTVCLINPENAPSIRVALKCGFAEYCRTTYHQQDTILFERKAG